LKCLPVDTFPPAYRVFDKLRLSQTAGKSIGDQAQIALTSSALHLFWLKLICTQSFYFPAAASCLPAERVQPSSTILMDEVLPLKSTSLHQLNLLRYKVIITTLTDPICLTAVHIGFSECWTTHRTGVFSAPAEAGRCARSCAPEGVVQLHAKGVGRNRSGVTMCARQDALSIP
jgi:hypothetical protein